MNLNLNIRAATVAPLGSVGIGRTIPSGFGSGASLFANPDKPLGRPGGYATIDDAISAARELTAEKRPAAAVLARDGAFLLAPVRYMVPLVPFTLAFRLDSESKGIRFHGTDIKAIVDGNLTARATTPGAIVPIT